jgi:hypothetical protein
MGWVGSQHVEEAIAEMAAVLTPQDEMDWQVPAGSLEWSCWETAAHVAHDLLAYAGQVAARATAGHWGMSDAAGFAAMGVAEALVHTYDITQGLGVAWLPPQPLCQLVVDRLLPHSPPGRATEILLWATGRADLKGHPRVSEWVWRAALS